MCEVLYEICRALLCQTIKHGVQRRCDCKSCTKEIISSRKILKIGWFIHNNFIIFCTHCNILHFHRSFRLRNFHNNCYCSMKTKRISIFERCKMYGCCENKTYLLIFFLELETDKNSLDYLIFDISNPHLSHNKNTIHHHK